METRRQSSGGPADTQLHTVEFRIRRIALPVTRVGKAIVRSFVLMTVTVGTRRTRKVFVSRTRIRIVSRTRKGIVVVATVVEGTFGGPVRARVTIGTHGPSTVRAIGPSTVGSHGPGTNGIVAAIRHGVRTTTIVPTMSDVVLLFLTSKSITQSKTSRPTPLTSVSK